MPRQHLSSDLITRTILGEEFRSLSSSLCSFFFIPLLSRPSLAQILSSTPYSQTPSTYVPPSLSATKFHTHTKQQAKLYFFISLSLNFWTANWMTKDSALNGESIPRLSLLLISSWIEFLFIRFFPHIWTRPPFPRSYYQSVFILWLRPACWSRHMTTYFVL